MIKRLLITIFIVYLIFLGLLFIFQRDLMYHQKRYNLDATGMTMKDFINVTMKAEDGIAVYGWQKIISPSAPIIIYFHGNAETVPDNIAFLRALSAAGYNVFAMEYRGYGPSYEEISEEGIYNDARATIDHVRKFIPDNNIILFGRSLGTGVAMKMASEYNVGGVVLLSPFTSIEDVAQIIYPYFPIKWLSLIKDNYNSLELASKVDEPILILHGRNDTLVPLTNAEILAKGLSVSEGNLIIFDDADHIDGFETGRIISAINNFAGRGL